MSGGLLGGVLLDVGGVLLLPDGIVVGPPLVAAGIDFAPKWEAAHYSGVAEIDRDAIAAGDLECYLHAYVATLQIADAAGALEVLRPLWEAPSVDLWRHVIADSVVGLRQFAAAGIRVAVVSNSDGTVEEQLRLHEICQVGDGPGCAVQAVLDSAVVGVAKPDPAIFEMGVAALGLPREDVAFVGDSVRFDVAPAEAFGLQAFHFDPHRICTDPSHKHIAKLAELTVA